MYGVTYLKYSFLLTFRSEYPLDQKTEKRYVEMLQIKYIHFHIKTICSKEEGFFL